MEIYRRLAVCGMSLMLGLFALATCLDASKLDCLSCHSAPSMNQSNASGVSALRDSVHSSVDCVDCHVDLRETKLPHKPKTQPVNCNRCHQKRSRAGGSFNSKVVSFTDSVHARSVESGKRDTPGCKTCHGTHRIMPSGSYLSSVSRVNIPTTCGKCHFDRALVKRQALKDIRDYKNSVHSRMVETVDGVGPAAVCTDCHRVHNTYPSGKAVSSVDRRQVSQTCGNCHQQALTDYVKSVHGLAAARGVRAAPVCTDCHGEHSIADSSSPESSVFPTRVPATCLKCHENSRIQRRFGLPTKRLSSYVGSYHGVASKYGDITAANCASCHGAHNILPSTNPKSAVHKRNLPQTCGRCHPGAGENFAVGSIHVVPSPKRDAIVYWVRTFYTVFIAGLIGTFCCYIALDLRARLIGRLPWRKGGRRR